MKSGFLILLFVLIPLLCESKVESSEVEGPSSKKYKFEGTILGLPTKLHEKWKGSSEVTLLLRDNYGEDHHANIKADYSFVFF